MEADDACEKNIVMIKILLVGAGGCFGAIARYCLAGVVHRWVSTTFPLGTLVVNLTGCFIVGIILGFSESRGAITPGARVLLIMGFLGSFTTLSAIGYETVEMLDSGQLLSAGLNVLGNCGLAIVAVITGRLIIRMIAA